MVTVSNASPIMNEGGEALAASQYLYLPIIQKYYQPGFSNLSGRVYDASDRDSNIVNATVCLDGSNTSCAGASYVTTTGENGTYHFDNVPKGYYMITALADDHFPKSSDVLLESQDVVKDIALVSQLWTGDIEMRVVVEWYPAPRWPGSDCTSDGYQDGCPTDLDAHIWFVNPYGDGLHHFQDSPGNCSTGSNVCIELYAYEGPGPETAAVRTISGTPVYYYGVYHFYYDRLGVPPMYQTNAVVSIYRKDGTTQQYKVENATPGTGNFWYLFSMDHFGAITLTNCITNLPDDPDPEDSIVFPPSCPAQ